MKRSFSFILMVLFLCSFQVETDAITKLSAPISININNIIDNLDNYVKFMEEKETTEPLILLKKLPKYDEDSIIEESDLIVRGTITNKKEVAFEEYKNNQLDHTEYRDLMTLKINKVLKKDETNNEINEGNSINIYNESSPHNWYVNTIKIENNKEYILFLRKAKDDGLINYTNYGNYVINAPDWAVVLKENNKYYYDQNFSFYEYISEGRKEREEGSGYNTYISSKFEERLSDSIVSFIKNSKITAENNSLADMNCIDINNIKDITLNVFYGEKKLINSIQNKEKIIELLKNIKIESTDNSGVPGNIPGYYIEITYKDKYKYKSEDFRILNSKMNYAAWDKDYNNLSYGYYNVDQDILPKLKMIYSSL